ncbi:MAG TPA: hypothetical protein EYP10_13415 [Armatimonadetes bacterium]|nr:hypothetical protein [Armatimonadota bacterium]
MFINGKPALRKTDTIAAHGCAKCPPHGRNLAVGSATVNINGLSAGRIGDGISCGGVIGTGSPDVIIGDTTWAAGTGEVTPILRFVVSQVPGSTKHGYYREPYKLYHNDSLVQEGLTDDHGIIMYEPDEVSGEFMIEAVNTKWKLTAQGLAPADTEAGIQERLEALSYHSPKGVVIHPNESHADAAEIDIGSFQAEKSEDHASSASDRIKSLIKTIIP